MLGHNQLLAGQIPITSSLYKSVPGPRPAFQTSAFSKLVGPVDMYLDIFENLRFFPLCFSLQSTSKQCFQVLVMKVFENGLQRENAGLSFSCGRMEMEVYKYDDVID